MSIISEMTQDCTVLASEGTYTAEGSTGITGSVTFEKEGQTYPFQKGCYSFRGHCPSHGLPKGTLTASGDVFVGGCLSASGEVQTYRFGDGGWADIIRIPSGTRFIVEMVHEGSVEDTGVVKVSIL